MEYFRLAEELKDRPLADQAAMRSAISRAYYASFNKAADKMQADGTNPPTSGDTHKAVWDHFTNSSDRFRKNIGSDGMRLKRLRVDADYRADPTIAAAQVADALIKAGKILKLLPQLKP
jgi:uncharacterized protein (UPF0332 family)